MFVEAALHGGHDWAIEQAYIGEHKDSDKTVSEVKETLAMWQVIEQSHAGLSKQDKERVEKDAEPFGKHVMFPGFDGNYEGEHISVANFMVNEIDRFAHFKGRDLNSHFPMIDAYRRMVRAFKPMGWDLNAGEIIALLNAKHASNYS